MTGIATISRSVYSACGIVLLLLFPGGISAQTVEVLHSFSGCAPTGCLNGDDGAHPQGTLVQGSDGFLYGTTAGSPAGSGGTVFKFAPNGAMTVLFTFVFDSPGPVNCINGCGPVGMLAFGSDGAFYGVTAGGGLDGQDGVLFRITSDGSFTKLHEFDDGIPSDERGPLAGLVQGLDGKFYGTTTHGGTSGLGSVFRLEADGSITTLHSFSGPDGQMPRADLMRASDGNIYGTTWFGGTATTGCGSCGTIFRILADGTVSMVHAFDGTAGYAPVSGLTQGTDGNLYGTNSGGGLGCGTAFRSTLDGSVTLLHAFNGASEGCAWAPLAQGADGNWYGTTVSGVGSAKKGTIFRMTPAGVVSVLHNFLGPEGARPFAGLVQGSDGHLYGTTYEGGDHNLGVVFRVVFPTAQSGTLAVVEDTATDGVLIATDPNNVPLTFSIVSNGSLGAAMITDAATGAFTYTPDANANGTDSFTFKASNGTVDTNVARIAVTIAPVNDAPAAQSGSITTNEDTATGGMLAGSDVDGDSSTFSIVTNGTKGIAVITNSSTGAFTYTPDPDANGSDSFTFNVSDGALESIVAVVGVTIAPANDPPVASDGTASTTPGTPVSGTLVASDIDSSTLIYSIVANGTKGTAVVTNATAGAYTYTPDAGASGADTFTFEANDGDLNSNLATITVTIGGNAPPVASNGTSTTLEDRVARGFLQATDPEGQAVIFSLVSNGTKGTATITNASTGRYRYVPQRNANGTDSLTFLANDGQLNSNVAMVTVTITPVNDAPVARRARYLIAMNANLIGTLIATDVDGDALTYAIVRPPQAGVARILDSETGAFSYTPDTGVRGTDSFTFTATDSSGRSGSARVRIRVTRCGC